MKCFFAKKCVFDTDIKILKKIWLNRKEIYLQKNTLFYIQQIISLENFIAKGRIAENFCTVSLFLDRQNVVTGLNYAERQKISTQYKHSLYN